MFSSYFTGEGHCKKLVIRSAKQQLFAFPFRGSGQTRGNGQADGWRAGGQPGGNSPSDRLGGCREWAHLERRAGRDLPPSQPGHGSHLLLPVRSDVPTAPPPSRAVTIDEDQKCARNLRMRRKYHTAVQIRGRRVAKRTTPWTAAQTTVFYLYRRCESLDSHAL